MFTEGNIVFLQSNASGKSLRINQSGDIEGVGGRGELAQFRVHVRRPGVVALQNVRTAEYWLAIYQGKTIGTVRGGVVVASQLLFVVVYMLFGVIDGTCSTSHCCTYLSLYMQLLQSVNK